LGDRSTEDPSLRAESRETQAVAEFGLHRLWWMVLAIAATNIASVQLATKLFGKSGFAAVPVVRGATASATLLLLCAWWLLSNQWDARIALSRRAGALGLLMVVWLCFGLYSGAPLGYVASDTFFLFHSVIFLVVFQTYFSRADSYLEDRGRTAAGPYDQWFATPLWLIALAAAGFIFPQVQLPPSIALLIVVGAMGSLIAGRYNVKLLFGGMLMMIYATTGDRAFLFGVVVALLCGLYISRRSRSLQIVLGVALMAVLFTETSSFTGVSVSHQADRITEVWTSLVDVANGGRIEDLPVSLYQPVYEGQLVVRSMEQGGVAPMLLGYGSGASLDMSSSNDISVAEASLLGLEHVHNIHLLPFMILYRYGIVGLVCLAGLVYGLVRQLVALRRRYVEDGTHLGVLLAVAYVLAWLTFAFPAGGFIFENPLMFICIAAVWAAAKSERIGTRQIVP
jgi:hypothetical protein